MLVLTRRPTESIIIGDNEIKITVLSSNSGSVRLGVEASMDWDIHREEIFLKIKAEEADRNG